MVKWATILLACAGCALGLYTIATAGDDQPAVRPPAVAPSVNPYPRGVAASGSIEAASRNVQVAAPEPALVMEVMAEVGEVVRKGDVLARLDARLLEADLLRASAARAVADAELARLIAEPRAEDLPPLKAALKAAEVRLADAKDQFDEMTRAREKGAGSPNELNRRRFAVDAAQAEVDLAAARLDLTAKGAWAPVVTAARARVAAADADLQAIHLRLQRFTILAPIDGTILKRNIEPGQFAMSGGGMAGSMSSMQGAAFVLGDVSTLRVRARVDEEDAPQLVPGARATARVRGVSPHDLPLRMLRIEPLAEPKMNLMGTTTERVDTRVVEVIFEVVGAVTARVYPGQAVDVFIEGAPPK